MRDFEVSKFWLVFHSLFWLPVPSYTWLSCVCTSVQCYKLLHTFNDTTSYGDGCICLALWFTNSIVLKCHQVPIHPRRWKLLACFGWITPTLYAICIRVLHQAYDVSRLQASDVSGQSDLYCDTSFCNELPGCIGTERHQRSLLWICIPPLVCRLDCCTTQFSEHRDFLQQFVSVGKLSWYLQRRSKTSLG